MLQNKSKVNIDDLNKGQLEGFELMVDFLHDRTDDLFLLEGYAGTGKTYLVKKIIKHILAKGYQKIAITAPTNKAVKVLARSADITSLRIEYLTIHKLLGLREQITEEGEQLFVSSAMDKPKISQFSYLIIDEVSMLDDNLFLQVIKHRSNVKIILMGDPAQIPPVNKEDSIPFTEENQKKYRIRKFRLTEIMRQASTNPIVAASFVIREDLYNTGSHIKSGELNDKGHGIVLFDQSSKAELSAQLKQYFTSDNFKQNADYVKIIAWTNVIVDQANDRIRTMLFGANLDKIVVGEKLLANTPIWDDEGAIEFQTNDEFSVLEFSVESDKFQFDPSIPAVELDYYDIKVEYREDGTNNLATSYIQVLHEDSKLQFDLVISKLKKAAKLKTRGPLSKMAWQTYYAALRTFADVSYNYAITAHKAQGSTYGNVFILEDDMNKNPRVYERNRIKYTSFTRPTDKLFLYR